MSDDLIKRDDAEKKEFTKGFAWGLGLGCGVQMSVILSAVFIIWLMP